MKRGKGEWILVVEDDMEVASLVQAVLMSFNYNTVHIKNGEDALEIYKIHEPKFDLVFSDLGLPNMSGVELFEKLLELNPFIKFIGSSGFGHKDVENDLLSKGVKYFLGKPYSPEKLLEVLRNVIEK